MILCLRIGDRIRVVGSVRVFRVLAFEASFAVLGDDAPSLTRQRVWKWWIIGPLSGWERVS